MTGIAPQSHSAIIRAASCKVASGEQDRGLVVISDLTLAFIGNLLQSAVMFEVLNLSFVLFGRGARREGS
jgi:hypothetical protein